MRVLKAQLYNEKNDVFTDIYLPASHEEIEDALQIIGGTADECATDIQHFLGEDDLLFGKTIKSCNIFEMNYFSQLIQGMSEYDRMQFSGLVQATTDEQPEMKTVINLALNNLKMKCPLAPASNDHDLGEFYVENELVGGLANLEDLSDEDYEWVCDHLDLAKIGKEVRENEQGAFVSGGYIVITDEIQELYDGNPVLPQPKDYIFKVELAQIPMGDEPNDEHTVSLKLPATEEDINSKVNEIGLDNLQDCCFYGYESCLPQLCDILIDVDEIESLNDLAKKLTDTPKEDMLKYKAMLDAVECKDVATAVAVYEKMDGFKLDTNCNCPTDYANKVLQEVDMPMKRELLFYLSKDGYGRALMQSCGVEHTSYGMVIPDNGISLKEQLKEPIQTMELSM